MSWASFALQTVGIQLTSAAKSAFITGLNIIMVPLFVAAFFKTKVPLKIWISTVLALVGVSVMSFVGFDRVETGDLLVLACDVFYALYIIYLDRNLKKVDLIAFSMVVLFQLSLYSFLTSLIFEPWASIFGELAPQIFTLENGLVMLYMGIIATTVAQMTQVYGQSHVSSTRTAIIFALEPLFATFFAVVFGEFLTQKIVIGGVLILIGVLVSIEKSSKKKM